MKNIIYKDEFYKIKQKCYEVYNNLGPGLLEVVYKDALEIEFNNENIPFEREKLYEIFYKGVKLPHYYKADFVVYDKIILEIKAVETINKERIVQTLNHF